MEGSEWRYDPPRNLQKILDTDWSKAGPKHALETLQFLIGLGKGIAGNDRDPNRAANSQFVLEIAHEICIQVRSRWKP